MIHTRALRLLQWLNPLILPLGERLGPQSDLLKLFHLHPICNSYAQTGHSTFDFARSFHALKVWVLNSCHYYVCVEILCFTSLQSCVKKLVTGLPTLYWFQFTNTFLIISLGVSTKIILKEFSNYFHFKTEDETQTKQWPGLQNLLDTYSNQTAESC